MIKWDISNNDSLVLAQQAKRPVVYLDHWALRSISSSESWLERFAFKESAHHLLLTAFLQRAVNAGGEITREMAVGNGRVDLLVHFHKQKIAMELKINRRTTRLKEAIAAAWNILASEEFGG